MEWLGQILVATVAIWVMLYVWIRVTDRHNEAMKDVDPCRLRGGCAGCNQLCRKE